MSDHFITVIPTDPYFVASADALRKAQELLSTVLASAEQIEMHTSDEVAFVDQGGNFERISCPRCRKELTTLWWQDAMDKSHESGFQRLDIITPCCAFSTSLNDLEYRWPAGFARCWVRAREPRNKELSPHQLAQLEDILGTTLRQIWTHY
jgi:hypothetical protein